MGFHLFPLFFKPAIIDEGEACFLITTLLEQRPFPLLLNPVFHSTWEG